jgi:hypothetical protein
MKYKIICLQNAGFSSWDEPRTRGEIIETFMSYAYIDFDEVPPKRWFTLKNIADVWQVEFEKVKEQNNEI